MPDNVPEQLIETATRAVEHNTVAYAAMRSGEFDRSETDRYIREIVVVALAAAEQEQVALDSAEIDRLIANVQARIDGQPRRLKACVEQWPDCESGAYHPDCCRFPKSCSATVYDEELVSPADLEPCPTCSGPRAYDHIGKVCETCGTDYGRAGQCSGCDSSQARCDAHKLAGATACCPDCHHEGRADS